MITVNTDVDIYVEDVLDQLDDDDLLTAIQDRGLKLPPSLPLDLVSIIEPFLPDSVERPARWLAMDIADAIMGAGRHKRQAA